MILGALTFTFLSTSTIWNGANPFEAFRNQHFVPSWIVVLFLLFAIVQLFGINSLDLYSSGVSLQAMGLRLKRYQAVVLDSFIACGLTIWAEFQSTFSLYMKEFVGVIILWIAPWLGIYLVDWILRRYRYNPAELQRTDKGGIYFTGSSGVNWNAIVAFVVGVVCATLAFSKAPPPVGFPFHWMTPISNHYGAFFCSGTTAANCGTAGWFGGADFSVPTGVIIAGLVYFVLEKLTGNVARQVAKQKELEPNR
jgi:purine-cytosine permease-like protein